MIRSFARRFSIALVLGLTVLWLVLNQTLAPGQVALGLLIGGVLSWAGATLRPVQARLRRVDQAVVLLCIVLADIVRSSFHVARIVLGLTGSRAIHSAFVDVPLQMRDPHGLAALATILTSTPGSVWVGLSEDGRWLRVHVLDLQDEAHWIRLITQRYERRLMRIFE
jgi:multicomponent K+:H+ antiporter subunit E